MKVVLTRPVHKQLLKLPKNIHAFISEKILLLVERKSNLDIKKLSNREGYRLRIGDYRVIYTTSRKEITVLSVAHRKEAYRG